MGVHIIILEEGYPNRESMKKALEKRGKKILNIKEAVEYYFGNNGKLKKYNYGKN